MSESNQTNPASTSSLPADEQVKHYRARYLALEELLEFAAENGKLDPPDLASEVKQLKKVLFYTPEDMLSIEEICLAEAELEKLYAILTELVHPVDILTLRTTSDDYKVHRPRWQAVFLGSSSVGRNFFRQLFWVALILCGLIFWREYTTLDATSGKDPLSFIDPFLYGALGALIYLYKDLTNRYTNRALHPKKLSTNWLRLFMGALVGGLIVHLFGPFMKDMMPNESFNASSGAVGFLAGYSVDFFYLTLERLIRAIIPKKTNDQQTIPTTSRQVQMDLLTKRLKEMTDEEDKVAIRRLLEKL